MKKVHVMLAICAIATAISVAPIQNVAHAESAESYIAEGYGLMDQIEHDVIKAALKGKTKFQEAVNKAINGAWNFVDRAAEY